MRDFRRSVIRLLAATCFLLLVAWVFLKYIQYHGDLEQMLRGLRNSEVSRFILDRVMPFFQQKLAPFFRDTVAPRLRELIEAIKSFIHAGG